MKRVVLLTILLTCLMAAPAMGLLDVPVWVAPADRGYGFTSDHNNDGNSVIRYWKEAPFRPGFSDGIANLNSLPSPAPTWRPAKSKARAEVIFRPMPYNDPQNKHGTNGAIYCDNRAEGAYDDNNAVDITLIDQECPNKMYPVTHEGGHDLGERHTPNCLDYQDDSVMVPCNIKLSNFGWWDKAYVKTITPGH